MKLRASPFNRRSFLHLGAASVAVRQRAPVAHGTTADDPVLAKAIATIGSRCRAPHGEFNSVERGATLPYTLCHWAALLRDATLGKYHLRCRTVDLAGNGQPMPRPFLRAGWNAIQKVPLLVEV